MKPIPEKSIWNSDWKYTPSALTDLRKTFARARKQMNLPEAQPRAVVLPIAKAKK